MHKNATKCNKTQSKWCINKHRALKIIDTFEMYQPSPLPSEPCHTLAHVDRGGLDSSDSLLSMDIGHVVSLSDEIAEIGVLSPNSEALFAKELSYLLVSLEAVSPGYGMELACVLAGKVSEDMIKKMKKSLRSKRKKRVVS
jgi:hypothetical protein